MAVLNPYNYARPKGVIANKPSSVIKNTGGYSGQKNQKNNADQYLEQKILTASPEELTLLLYEGAIKFIKQAKIFNNEKSIEKTSNAIIRAQAIYSELRATLNTDYKISSELDRLYEYILFRLAEANIQKKHRNNG